MSIRRVLLLIKPFTRPNHPHQFLGNWDDRCRVHKDTINLCKDVLQRRSLKWESIMRNKLCQPICNFDLVITVGGDGTLLQASHFMDDKIPVMGVNSDPTQDIEVEEKIGEFDATRSTGYLCAATGRNFEQVLDEVLEGNKTPSELTRILIRVNDLPLSTYPLNDVLIAHPCPAAVSSFSFQLKKDLENSSALVHCRSSGLRICTAAGSTAAMLSAGGYPMPILSRDLHYMVREPIHPGMFSHLMHGSISPDQSIHIVWKSVEGMIYIDGCHVFHPIQYGSNVEISAKAPVLKVFLPSHLVS
ncbi:probable NADH kinase isoform X1 [Amborella trichopoda]|uniref:probable NADH kinase isoform X1 n=1 Tax=Amborella trichopoda TaxID=13333 RepID=UPI0005D42DFD|nr:probable NADH kinase isoform X1 [Amborella trichopoda]|eukprot:XP_011626329.1 probable NADH kinase isoform X1 [Amborella trichopoda]